jgi:predicted component of type VI protein secretion system
MPFLEHDGVTRELPVGDTLVGSGSEADWRLQTINIAPRHFSVHVEESGAAVLTALRAQDVDVNGSSVPAPCMLADGDEIIAGAGIFTFRQQLEAPAPAPPPPSGARAYLVDIAAGAAYPLARDSVGIGRDPVNHVVVRDLAVSRFHAEVKAAPTGGGFTFRSMGAGGSTLNGSLVGGAPRALTEGDLIRVGGTALRYTLVPPPAAVRIVHRADVPASGPSRQPTPIARVGEPITADPPMAPAGRWIAGRSPLVLALMAGALVVVVLIVWTLFAT